MNLCPDCRRPEYPRTMRGSVGTICMASYAPLDLAQVRDCLTLALAIVRKERDDSEAKLPCGHSTSLLLRAIESGTEWCDLCDTRQRLSDAVLMERTIAAERDEALARVKVLESALDTAQVCVCQWGCIKVAGPPSGMIHCAECKQIQLAIRGAKPGL